MGSRFPDNEKNRSSLVIGDIRTPVLRPLETIPTPKTNLAAQAARIGAIEPQAHGFTSPCADMGTQDCERFLRIVLKASQIRHHYELFLMLQGEIQHFISHQIFIAAWGDFRSSRPALDIVSSLPDVRTAKVNGCGVQVEALLKDLHTRWVANGRRKMLLTNGLAKSITFSTCNCSLHNAMRGIGSILVHGVHNKRDEIDSLYLALDPDSVMSGQSVEHFFQMVDPLIYQIDIAFRNVSTLAPASHTDKSPAAASASALSVRELEIMKWVADGRTNVGIGEILGISPFTVKNHIQRIFSKLGANNRTEAVAKCNQSGLAK
jgi:transcriptional regulator EpsA